MPECLGCLLVSWEPELPRVERYEALKHYDKKEQITWQIMPAGVIALLALGMFGRYGMVVYQVCSNII